MILVVRKRHARNVKQKYDMIDGSKSMMGNTFSDFIGAVLGAVINLFTYIHYIIHNLMKNSQ